MSGVCSLTSSRWKRCGWQRGVGRLTARAPHEQSKRTAQHHLNGADSLGLRAPAVPYS